MNCKASITGQYLSGKRSIAVPAMRREPGATWLVVRGAREHNLKDIDVEFPLGCFVSVTGVSGSGKSTLINDILLRALMQRIYKSRAVPGRHRSDRGRGRPRQGHRRRPVADRPHAALEPGHLHGHVRQYPQALRPDPGGQVRGYQPGRFSFNVRAGAARRVPATAPSRSRCTSSPTSTCPVRSATAPATTATPSRSRSGARPSPTCWTCPVRRHSTSSHQPPIARHMQTLVDVGLGYVRLGQPAPTLSGGEAQRVKLASELAAAPDRPHPLRSRRADHRAPLRGRPQAARRAAAAWSTRATPWCVIEHNLDVVKSADWVIDLGPEGGTGRHGHRRGHAREGGQDARELHGRGAWRPCWGSDVPATSLVRSEQSLRGRRGALIESIEP